MCACSPCATSSDEVHHDSMSQAGAAIAFGAVGMGTVLIWVLSHPWVARMTPTAWILQSKMRSPATDLPPARKKRQCSEPLMEPKSLILLVHSPCPCPCQTRAGGKGRACPGQRASSRSQEVTCCSVEQWEQSDPAVDSSVEVWVSPPAELQQPGAAAYKS